MSAQADPWLRRLRATPRPVARLVCFPPAGADALFYLSLAQALPHAVQVEGVQYPGRRDRRAEAPARSVGELAAGAAAAMAPDLPVALFGHGMGAVVAFETALRLPSPPLALFVSGAPGPPRHRVAERAQVSGTAQADLAAAATYRWGTTRLAAPVVGMLGDADPVAKAEEVATWAEVTTEPFELQLFGGGHQYLTSFVSTVATAVGERVVALLRGRR
ncbi:thioesterase II family protein [Actinokineospora sp. G85]|uniref:thioesterase II family protein n=1 Tax=Actinokineospora sp. G85 TaxID=3406626 RepID=UPI003C772247